MFTFRKEERLCRRKIIATLFTHEVKRFYVYPFKVTFLPAALPEDVPAQVLMVVSKKFHPKSVHRNYLKRLMREAYRKNKHLLYPVLEKQNLQLAFMLNYAEKDILPYQKLENKIIVILQRLAKMHAETHPDTLK